jgi:hypothetical protein
MKIEMKNERSLKVEGRKVEKSKRAKANAKAKNYQSLCGQTPFRGFGVCVGMGLRSEVGMKNEK